jgi:hypothetical protein
MGEAGRAVSAIATAVAAPPDGARGDTVPKQAVAATVTQGATHDEATTVLPTSALPAWATNAEAAAVASKGASVGSVAM